MVKWYHRRFSAEGPEFDSRQEYCFVAQLVEQPAVNRKVAGSSPA